MILVTVGTQLPFARLIDAVAAACAQEEVFAQVGPDDRTYPFDSAPYLTPARFEGLAHRARVIVGHAGVGTVLTAKRLGKPAILMPRRAKLAEHRTDHQMATARQLDGREGVYIAWQASDVKRLLAQPLRPPTQEKSSSQTDLIDAVRDFIDNSVERSGKKLLRH